MTQRYSEVLTTDRDWVRFLIGDHGATMYLEDEEIDATLAAQTSVSPASRYFAAAEILPALYGLWSAEGKGVVERQISKLRIRRSEGSSEMSAILRHAESLRKRGAFLQSNAATSKPYAFRMV
jgi:hypothetical protein